ncbi:MAG TPA: hypothetical protein VK465_11000 [Fibrobacteria bacterium]|nr:hypothetical protein [Fibrobacteria bacterium]
MLAPKYQFYATLLDAFAWYKRNESEEGLQEFLDKVNRVEKPKTAPQLRGLAFEIAVEKAAVDGIFPTEPIKVHDKKVRPEVIERFARGMGRASRQVFVETVLSTLYGPVRVYGYVDEILADTAYDNKTTSSYEFPKYLKAWQHPAYLEALRPMGIGRFVYKITDFEDCYEEEYFYRKEDTDRLISECAQLVECLEANRARITDRKVFCLPPLERAPA